MSKIETLATITNGYLANEQLNSNFAKITTALSNTVSRDGSTPNTLSADLDMNNNQLINLPTPTTNFQAATKKYVDDSTDSLTIAQAVTDCQTAQTAAELAETNAETAETNAETAETNAAASAVAAAASAALVPLSKYDATSAPDENEDSIDGYGVGSVWADVTNDRAYVCLDASVGAAIWKHISFDGINVKDFGAVGDGSTDDSAAFQAAFTAANTVLSGSGYLSQTTSTVFIPPGNYSIETGITFATSMFTSIKTLGKDCTKITLATGVVFITAVGAIGKFDCTDALTVIGGVGFLNNTNTGANVQGIVNIEGNDFDGYTGTCIGTLSEDFPYWKVRRNVFKGSTDLTSIGVVLVNDNTGLCIEENAFLRNRYSIKLRIEGNNYSIRNNDFVRFTNGGGSPALTDIWLVPKSSSTNAGRNTRIEGNKFGSEGSNVADYRILVAEEESGGTNAFDKSHATTATGNHLNGILVIDNLIYGDTQSLIYSYTYNLRHWYIDNPNYEQSAIDGIYVIEYDAGVSWPNEERTIDSNIIVPARKFDLSEAAHIPLSNEIGSHIVAFDPLGLIQGQASNIQYYTSGGGVSYTALLDGEDIINFSTSNATLSSAITDGRGGTNAVTATYSAAGGIVSRGISEANLRVGETVWWEIDLKQSSTQALEYITLEMDLNSGSAAFSRKIKVPENWTTIRFPWIPKQNGSALSYRILPDSSFWATGVTDKVDLGRPRLYHGSEPVNPACNFLQASATQNPSSLADGVGETLTFTVTGAALGDFVMVAAPYDLQDITVTGYVQSADTVEVRVQNESGSTIDLASGAWKVRVLK